MSHDPIIFGVPHFDSTESSLVQSVLESRWIGMGPLVEEFERRLADYLTAPGHPSPLVVSVSSCSAALELALEAMGVGPGDEVVTTPFTFVATINAIERVGAIPICADIDPQTLNIAPASVAEVLSPQTAAIMPVHFGGRSIDVTGLRRLADEHDLWIVEDAAHAVGGWAGGERVGAATHARTVACFSFYPNKNLASAEGGAVTTSDEAIASRIKSSRLHGLDVDAWERWTTRAYRPSMAVHAGQKANWTDLQAAIALAQLDKLEGFLAVREHLAGRYDDLLEEYSADAVGITAVDRGSARADDRHALHLYQVAVDGGCDRRDAIVEALKQEGIGVAVHYVAVHRHPYYAGRLERRVSLDHAEWASDSLISLPMHPGVSDRDQLRVIERLVSVER